MTHRSAPPPRLLGLLAGGLLAGVGTWSGTLRAEASPVVATRALEAEAGATEAGAAEPVTTEPLRRFALGARSG